MSFTGLWIDMATELQVWWIPQVPGQAFEYAVGTIETGETLMDALAKYDLFQLEHNIKPDYANVGGLRWRDPVGTDSEWWDLDPEEQLDVDEYLSYADG